MSDTIRTKLIEIISPFVKNKELLGKADNNTSFLKDLEVSSSRLVDIVLDIEDAFTIEIADDEADKILSIGAAIELIQKKLEAKA